VRWKRRTKKEMTDILKKRGYEFIGDYFPKDGFRHVIFKDKTGYKYDVRIANIIINQHPHPFAMSNPFTLRNIRIWLKINKKTFSLCKDSEYIDSFKHKIKFYCRVCRDHFYMEWGNVQGGCGCAVCAGKQAGKRKNIGYKFPKSLDVWNYELNKDSPYQYTHSSDKVVWWNCDNKVHRTYQRTISSSVICGFRCSICSRNRRESFLQEKVRIYLTSLKLRVKHERDCSIIPINPKTGFLLPFDNEITKLKLIIEVNGHQHYDMNAYAKQTAKKRGTSPEEELKYQKWKDKYKKNYAISKGYSYLEIPYNADNKKETWKKLINDKIKEISNKKPSGKRKVFCLKGEICQDQNVK
jgi:hypothetical protein